MDSIAKELSEIGSIIAQARLIDTIKAEVHAVMGERRATVTGGEMADAPEFDVVVRHKAGSEASGEIVRRLGAMKNIEASLIERVADSLVCVKRKEK